jgi:hypothetical protein
VGTSNDDHDDCKPAARINFAHVGNPHAAHHGPPYVPDTYVPATVRPLVPVHPVSNHVEEPIPDPGFDLLCLARNRNHSQRNPRLTSF